MNVIVVVDAHITKNIVNNTYWSRISVYDYSFWSRYLKVFDKVNVVSRVIESTSIDETLYSRADGNGVFFTELPFVRGTKDYVIHFFDLKRAIKKIVADESCCIFRLPSIIGFLFMTEFKKLKKPYAIEVVANPYEVYKPNIVAQILFDAKLKKECMQANGVSYVTKNYLQNLYPSFSIKKGATNNYFDSYYSSAKIDLSYFGQPKTFYNLTDRPLNIIHVSNVINSDAKGHSTVLKICKNLKQRNMKFKVKFIGEGSKINFFKNMASQLQVSDDIEFLGRFSNSFEIREKLIESDIMIFPSHTEGLPRVLLEAMAIGLPCLSTPVGGIPELLDSDFLFNPFDVDGFTDKILQLQNNPSKMCEISKNNIEVAKCYSDYVLENRRNEFYKKLAKIGEEK